MQGVWSKPIEAELGKIGAYKVISDTEEAARVLLYEWPTKRGTAYSTAKQACLAVLEGKQDPDRAREAFLAAATEADISTRIWQRDVPEGKPVNTRFGKRRRR
ncbi:DUF982 domain-containing protein [Rhizobium sp. LC145]|uniref:DUF982 domain-containing protein n=1 Tax=Rhizobium sp. LC145 TaxID=1120688 RepID=UPI00069A37A1|nr:DUF982 domain-containing protein [Rhizobium sp. LC145]TKT46168.1 DUF982 domain-containing protein [Rhizobiaceae bacterium LC148]